ncbi:MAG: DHA2 family efflux MFS transporter permease subunit [Pseudomonadota bacterium]
MNVPIISKPATGPFTRAERVIITVPVLAASLLHAVNMTTAYVALPDMQGNLSATPSQIGWVITAFVLASAIGTIFTGWLTSRFGRRNVFLASIIGFTLTAMLCSTATGLHDLVLYRFLQGFVSAPLLPISQAIMLDTYPRERHGFAMSIWSMGMILGPVLGPTVGALLTEWYGWRYVFLINVPLGMLALAGIWLVLPKSEDTRRRLDWIGVLTLTASVCALQLMLDRGQSQDWFESTEIVLEAAIAALCAYIFIAHCLTHRDPYLNLAIFKDRNFVVGLVLIFVFGICAFSTMLVLPLFLQTVQAYPVLTAGWLLSVRGIGTMLAMMSGGYLSDRFPNQYLVLAGLICLLVSNAWMTTWNADVGVADVIWATLLSGFGMGMMWVTLTTVTFSTLEPRFRVEGAALFALIRAIGASAGTSVVIAVLVHSAQVNYIELRENITPFSESMRETAALAAANADSRSGLLSLYQMVIEQARVVGFLNVYVFLSVVTTVAMPLVFLLRTRKPVPA